MKLELSKFCTYPYIYPYLSYMMQDLHNINISVEHFNVFSANDPFSSINSSRVTRNIINSNSSQE